MKKQTYTPIILTIIILSMLIISGCSPGQLNVLTGSGLEVTSISQPLIKSKNDNLATMNWLVDTQLGGGSNLFGTISTTELNDKLAGTGQKVKYGFTLSASNIVESFNYDVSKDFASPIYKYQYYHYEAVVGEPACPAPTTELGNLDWQLYERNTLAKNVKHCIYKSLIGYKGDITGPTQNFKADLSVKFDNPNIPTPPVVTITNKDSTKNIGDFAIAKWLGYIPQGNPLPNIINDQKVYIVTTGATDVWKIIDTTTYNNYHSAELSFEKFLDGSITNINQASSTDVVTAVQSQVDIYNSAQNKLSVLSSLSSKMEVGGTADNKQLIYYSPNLINKERVTFLIRADAVGIEFLAGKPKIVSAVCPTFASGSQGNVQLQLQNIGTDDDTFVVTKTGCPSFTQQKSAEQISIKAGQTASFNLELGIGAVNQDISETCTIKVYDINDPLNSASMNAQCKLTKAQICTAGQQNVEGSCIKQCNTDGTGVFQVACCDLSTQDIKPVDGKYACVAKGVTCVAPAVLKNGACVIDNGGSNPSTLLLILSAILSGILTYYARLIVPSSKKRKWQKPVILIVIFIIGVFLSAYIIKGIMAWIKSVFTINWW